jgi:hypothetical protein
MWRVGESSSSKAKHSRMSLKSATGDQILYQIISSQSVSLPNNPLSVTITPQSDL